MWGVTMMFLCCVACLQVTSEEIKVTCKPYDGDFNLSKTNPSTLWDFKVTLLKEEENYMLNLTWAIRIDASIQYLEGTLIVIDNEPPYLCEYNPELSKAVLTGSKIWFHYLVKANHGHALITARNVPWPTGYSALEQSLYVPQIKQSTSDVTPMDENILADVPSVGPTSLPLQAEYVTVVIFGGLACVMILSSCYIIYKYSSAQIAQSFGFHTSTFPMVPVPVLIVHCAENSAFQQAVVALAEFLQWHGGCTVAIDIWQQGKIAELGPMRWLAEQVRAADRVLIVCPQPSLQPSRSPHSHSPAEPSIPAAAHDLYPLILNMVGSHARSANELAKFWVVQLGKQQDKRPRNLPVELRACKSFCLMKNLNKLCRSLHRQRQGKRKISDLLFRPVISYSDINAVKLKEAVDFLIRHQPGNQV